MKASIRGYQLFDYIIANSFGETLYEARSEASSSVLPPIASLAPINSIQIKGTLAGGNLCFNSIYLFEYAIPNEVAYEFSLV